MYTIWIGCALSCMYVIKQCAFLDSQYCLSSFFSVSIPSMYVMSCHVWCSTRQTYERGFKGRSGFSGFMWKLSRIGERLSPYVAACCVVMAVHLLFFR